MAKNKGNKRRFVIKIGGSLLFDDNMAFRKDIFLEFCSILNEFQQIAAVIVGGGKIARIYINAARSWESNESSCDLLGIYASRLNARLLITALGDRAYPRVVETIEDAIEYSMWGKLIVAGGITPGQSTTSVAFEISEAINASDLIIFTDVDGIYDKDPKKYSDAKKYDKIHVDELEQILFRSSEKQAAAGEYRIFDAVSLQILKRNSIKVRLVNGKRMDMIRGLIAEDPVANDFGTLIYK